MNNKLNLVSNFNDRFIEAFGERGVTEFAEEIGLSKQTISAYLNRARKPKRPTVEVLAEKLDVSPLWLLGYDVPMERKTADPYPQINQNTRSSLNSLLIQLWDDSHSDDPIPKKSIPMLGKIACGEPIYADEDFDTFIEVNSDLKADFCLTCSGDSMINANIFDGDIVFIKKQDIVDDGQIAAVIIEDEATLKRVYYDRKNNRLTLQAENPKYSPLVYIGEELNNIRILGRAISLYRKIK